MKQTAIDFFYRTFANEQMNFLYKGDFSDEHTDQFIELNNHQFSAGNEFKIVQRRAAFLIAECFQNMLRHSELSNENSFFHIKNNLGIFSLISGNTIKNTAVASLKSQLEELNHLTSEELRKVYRKTLEDGEFNAKGGAGLGLIEMARKTKNKLSFKFYGLDMIKSYFYFQLALNSVDQMQKQSCSEFDTDRLLKDRMTEEDLFLVYKGIASTQVTATLLQIIENTFESKRQTIGFTKLMGLLEQFSEELSSVKKEPSIIVLIGESTKEYKIETSCILSNLQARKLHRSFCLYEALDPDALTNEHLHLINKDKQEQQNDDNLHLIEMFKNCSNLKIDLRPNGGTQTFVNFTAVFKREVNSSDSITDENQENQNLHMMN